MGLVRAALALLLGVLLAAADDGYVASYLNQPIEVPGLRQQLRNELRLAGRPQLVMRVGRPSGPWPGGSSGPVGRVSLRLLSG